MMFATALAGGLLWLLFFGGSDQIAAWAADQQRDVQRGLAGALRAVKTGQPAAWAGLLGLCFSYGFLHAAGPGHGKLVMGGYALGQNAPRSKLIVLTLAGSLGQALTAITLVTVGAAFLGWGRRQIQDLADLNLALYSAGAVALVGLWLAGRGARRWSQAHHKSHTCCGHSHGPDDQQIAQATDWKSSLAVISVIAMRPCTGALFVLILTYAMGIWTAGIAGAIVMALGTSTLTLAVALTAGLFRQTMVDRFQSTRGVQAMAGIEICAGGIILVISLQTALLLL